MNLLVKRACANNEETRELKKGETKKKRIIIIRKNFIISFVVKFC